MSASKAQAEKEKGNVAFKAGDYPASIGHYTAALLADSSDQTFALNRAAAYLKLGKHADAERDCGLVLAKDSRNVKALFRRAQARIGLAKLSEAQADLAEAARIEPANDAVKQEAAKVKQLLEQLEAAPKKKPITVVPFPTKVLDKAAEKPVRRRIPIKIVEEDDAPPPAPSQAAATSPPDEDLMKPVSTRTLSATSSSSSNKTSATAPSPPQGNVMDSSTSEATTETREQQRRPKVGGGIFKANGTHTLFKGTTAVPQEHSSSRPSGSLPVPQQGSQAPTTLFTFKREWTNAASAQERWVLLCRTPPQAIPTLFQTSLEPSMLNAIVIMLGAILDQAEEPVRAAVKDYVLALETVPRFETLVMFMTRAEKENARTVLRTLGLNERAPRWGSAA